MTDQPTPENPPDDAQKAPPKDEEQPSQAQDNVLTYAWELYETYSRGAGDQKKSTSGIRQQVIWFIFMTSVLAVLTMLPGMGWVLQRVGNWITTTTPLELETVSRFGRFGLSAVLIILSVTTSAILTFAGQFSPLRAWVMYRVGADEIRSEIYLYRMRAKEYINHNANSQEIRSKFLERLETIKEEIDALETAPPFLQLLPKEGETTAEVIKREQFEYSYWRRLLHHVTFWKREKAYGKLAAIDPRPTKPTNPGEKVRLSGRYYPEHDNGFNPITIDDYINYRVIPQRNWYVKKVYEDYNKIKDYRKVTLTIGAFSAVLAAIQLEPYIVITTAAAVAVNTHIQLNLIGSNYGNYHLTASRLDSEIIRWRNLPDAIRYTHETVAEVVQNIESILETEREIWKQQASQAQQETEQTLIKGAGKRDIITTSTDDAYKALGTLREIDPEQLIAHSAKTATTPTEPPPTESPAINTKPTVNAGDADLTRKLEESK